MAFRSSQNSKPLILTGNSKVHTGSAQQTATGLVARWNPWILALLFTIFLFICNAAFDWFLMRRHESPFSMLEVSDGLSALVGGILFTKIVLDSRRRRRRLEQRLQTIRDMNHHIRNALEVIALTAHTSKDQENMEAIRQSVQRINWALNEILPKM